MTNKATNHCVADAIKRYGDELMAIPGVVGVAEGVSGDGSESVIHVYVDRPDGDRIPSDVGGIPIEVVVSGTFRAE